MELRDLNNVHGGQCCMICGTGPSFDPAAANDHDGPVIAINRAAFTIQPPSIWLVIDDAWGLNVPGPWHQFLGEIRCGNGTIAVLRDPMLAGRRIVPAPTGANIVRFSVTRDRVREMALTMSREQVAACGQLYERIGSAATAVHLAWYLGASRLRFNGIDGGTGVSSHVQAMYRPDESSDYSTGHRYAIQAAATLRLPIDATALAAGGAP